MQTKHSSLTAYVYDSDLRIEANRKGENYWYEYIKEVMDQLGLRASGIPRHQLEEDSVLDRIGVLIIGDLNEENVNRNIAAHLGAWIRRGWRAGCAASFAALAAPWSVSGRLCRGLCGIGRPFCVSLARTMGCKDERRMPGSEKTDCTQLDYWR